MELKKLGAEHREQIKRLIETAFTTPPWHDDWSDREQFEKYIADITANDNSLSLGLFDGGEIIGIALGRRVHWFEGTQFRIDDLCISPAHQGRGAGSEFLRLAKQYCRENGIQHITLKTNRTSAAYRFYIKNGFTEMHDDVYFETDT